MFWNDKDQFIRAAIYIRRAFNISVMTATNDRRIQLKGPINFSYVNP